MWNNLKTFLSPPVFPGNETKTNVARNTHAASLVLFMLIFLYQLTSLPRISASGLEIFDYITLGLALGIALLWVILKRGAVYFVAISLVGLFWLAANGVSLMGDGIRSIAFTTNLPIVLLAGLLLGWRGALVYAFATIFAGYRLAYLEETGRIVPTYYPPFVQMQDSTMVLFLTGALTFFLITDLSRATQRANANARLLEQNLTDLNAAQSELLEKTNALEKRTEQLAAANAVTQTVIGMREIEDILPHAVASLAEKFDYYHVGIYLLDDKMEHGFLQAASSEGGKRMLARQHQIDLTDDGILQRAAKKRAAQTMQEVDLQTRQPMNPDLPLTRSFGAFPMLTRERVIGILDIQRVEPLAFSTSEVDTLQIIADQISLTIENARLFAEAQSVIEQMQQSSETRAELAWREIANRGAPVYQYTPLIVQKIGLPPERKEEPGLLSEPILLRGQGIGRIQIRRKSGPDGWLEAEQNMVREVAAQIALALDNARLLEEAQMHAAHERAISEMSARIGAASNIETILRATAQEVGKALGDAEITVKLRPEGPEN
ncbi:MAG: hypothetical protein HFACDABA_01133 [Anaerolineales bacterium]|nr:hypothetical protein [Anaerolineales bacterium]